MGLWLPSRGARERCGGKAGYDCPSLELIEEAVDVRFECCVARLWVEPDRCL